MRVIPVMDVMGGEVVRGIAGRRAEYRPVVSRLTPSCRPLEVARAFRERFGLTELYVADLDAIAGREPALPLYGELHRDGYCLWVDAGVRRAERIALLADAAVEIIVVGLETVAGPGVVTDAIATWGRRVVLSLDLKEGISLGETGVWGTSEPDAIAERAVALGVCRLIVLDLARVGVAGGTGTVALCARLAAAHPDVEVVAGGGVRDADDLRRLAASGVRTVLVASALHDGRLTRADWQGL